MRSLYGTFNTTEKRLIKINTRGYIVFIGFYILAEPPVSVAAQEVLENGLKCSTGSTPRGITITKAVGEAALLLYLLFVLQKIARARILKY